MLIKDKGICLRSTDYSDSSQILTFFTQQNGKVSLIAKGTKKPKSSFGGPIQLCGIGDMVFALKDEDKLGMLTEFNPTFFGTNTRKRLLALNCSLLAAEFLNLFTKEHDPHPAVFEDAKTFLERLENCSDAEILHWLTIFEFSILEQTGSTPICNGCSNCRRPLTNDWQDFFFSSTANGLLCRDCEGVFIDRKTITYNIAKHLNTPAELLSDKAAINQTQNLLLEYISHVLERPLKTAGMVLKLIK
ncbi:MAG TPA: DNA repair protein RecO [Phycisphaerales bacterium]|nr:MAG: DNA repair protein RecO [Planctomycetes bacterium GWC2_45_44]HBG78244.1 DNA repair protein RecO [Phycisphaerales bacterium]HBR18795.1 DNA repair protein RecO [Phycisphaerales bacterium]